MATINLDDLLKLPPGERREIAFALWESLDDDEQDAAFELTPELKAELDRRWANYKAHPETSISLEVMMQRLRNRP